MPAEYLHVGGRFKKLAEHDAAPLRCEYPAHAPALPPGLERGEKQPVTRAYGNRSANDGLRILIVEDDEELANTLARQLHSYGLVVDIVSCGEDALLWPNPEALDGMVLDLGLPDMDGLEVIRAWRARGYITPIIVLSGRSDWHEKVDCLNAGAEDYVVKPIRMEEMAARLKALNRRIALRPLSHWISFGDVRLHPETKMVEIGGKEITVSAMEFRLLLLLLKRQGGMVTQDEALDALYSLDDERQPNTIEAHVARLRRKIGRERIINQRGLGYKLAS